MGSAFGQRGYGDFVHFPVSVSIDFAIGIRFSVAIGFAILLAILLAVCYLIHGEQDSMPDLMQVVRKIFRFMGTPDTMPHGVKARRRGQQDGRVLLAQTMRDMEFRVGAEIGTRYGASAKLWCETIPGLQLTCIDPYSVYRMR